LKEAAAVEFKETGAGKIILGCANCYGSCVLAFISPIFKDQESLWIFSSNSPERWWLNMAAGAGVDSRAAAPEKQWKTMD